MKSYVTLNGVRYSVVSVLSDLTVPDCFVLAENKIGTAHGERKFYVGEKNAMGQFFGPHKSIKCIALKRDFQIYVPSKYGAYITSDGIRVNKAYKRIIIRKKY